jgi:hypothetical protein
MPWKARRLCVPLCSPSCGPRLSYAGSQILLICSQFTAATYTPPPSHNWLINSSFTSLFTFLFPFSDFSGETRRGARKTWDFGGGGSLVFDRSNTGYCEFESLSRHGCVSAFFCLVLSCVGTGLATGWSPVQGVLPNVQNRFRNLRIQIQNRNRPEGLIQICCCTVRCGTDG